MDDWARRRRVPAWREHAPIRADFAKQMSVESRARAVKHDFLYRTRRDERVKGLAQVDYLGDWQAAEKAFTGVEVRDPTADIDVVSYCFGVPPQQYLAEGIDRSLIRRAMWGLLPEAVLTNRLSGLQGADWHRKLEARRGELAQELDELSKSALVRRVIDLGRLENAIKRLAARRLAQGRDFPRIQSRADARAGRRPFYSLDRISKLTALRGRGQE